MTAVLFDLDGTIADSISVIIDTAIKTCHEFNIAISDADIAALIGAPLVVQGEKLLGAGRGEEYRAAYQRIYFRLQENCIHPFEGMMETIKSCRNMGAKIALVTSKGKEGTEFTLKCLQLDELLDCVVNAHTGCGFKPDAEPALFAMQQINELPNNSIFVGDSIFDLRCGKNAGCYTCAVLWGAGTKDELIQENPDYIVETPQELKKILSNFINLKSLKENSHEKNRQF